MPKNHKIRNLPLKGKPKPSFILIGELLYISCPSLKGEIILGKSLNNLIGVAVLNIIILYSYFERFVFLLYFKGLLKLFISLLGTFNILKFSFDSIGSLAVLRRIFENISFFMERL